MKRKAYKTLLVLVLTVCIALALPTLAASADNVGEFTQGENIGYIQIYSLMNLSITGCNLHAGGLAPGLTMSWDEHTVYLSGTPQSSGNYIAQYRVFTSEGSSDFEISFSVKAPAVEETPEPTEQPEEKPTGAPPKITKDPTGEYVEVGDDRDVKFIAKAENFTKRSWRLVSPDSSNTIQAKDAPDYFPGLEVSGTDTDTLILKHIPREMNGWYVDVKFDNSFGYALTSGAKITLVNSDGDPISAAAVTPTPAPSKDPTASTPPTSGADLPVNADADTATISVQPESVQLNPGDKHTLSVVASSPNGGSLSYQWYSAATENFDAALPISGASDASYTINQTTGTAYYWVAVWNAKDGSRSQAVYSEPAPVSIATSAEATPTPAPTPEPTPARNSSMSSSVSFQLILFSIIGVLALAALVGVVLYLRADAKRKGGDE